MIFFNDPLNKYGRRNWGTYEIMRDTIKAIIFCEISGNGPHSSYYRECYYQGKIQDEGIIVDWKLIPPYPKYYKRYDGGYIEGQMKPQTLKFKKFPAKTAIDSNAAWINKYISK